MVAQPDAPAGPAADGGRPLPGRRRVASRMPSTTVTESERHRRRVRRASPTSTATSGACSSRPTGARGSRRAGRWCRPTGPTASAGAVVGLHYHLHQADYWYVPFGTARVVLHDLREGGPTDGATLLASTCSGENHLGVFIPPGVAHGFAALTDMTITYLVDGYYNPADELGVAWDDPDDRRRLGRRPTRSCPSATATTPPGRPARGSPPLLAPTRRCMKLLVTGGAGFIGSNFVRYWLDHHPTTTSWSSTPSPTRASARAWPTCIGRIELRARRHRRPRARRGGAASHARRRRRELRRRVPQQPRHPRPGLASSARTCSAPRRCARRPGASASAASTTSRPARCTATSPSTPTEPFTEESPYRPRTPYNASKAGGDHAVRAYHATYGPARSRSRTAPTTTGRTSSPRR